MKKYILTIIITAAALLAGTGAAQAATYWVSSTGQAAWVSCKSDTPLSGASACNIYTACRNAVAGDTVYLREGTYVYTYAYSASIVPTNSGSSGNPITFSNYNGENVTLDGNKVKWSTGLKIGKNYIKAQGINFKNFEYTFEIQGGKYNEISYCAFDQIRYIPSIQHNAQYNWIHHSTFSNGGGAQIVRLVTENKIQELGLVWSDISGKLLENGWAEPISPTEARLQVDPTKIEVKNLMTQVFGSDFEKIYPLLQQLFLADHDLSILCEDGGGLLDIGDRSDTWAGVDFSSYNLLENNHFYYGAHYTIAVQAPFNVIRNNYFHNENWMECSQCGKPCATCGNRVVASFGSIAYRTLWENNRIGYGGIPPDNDVGEGLELASSYNIVRFNKIFGNAGAGILPYDKGMAVIPGDPLSGNPNHNYIYSNTIFHNGYNNMPGYYSYYYSGIYFANSFYNVVKNNIVMDSPAGAFKTIKGTWADQSIEHNWIDPMGDPLFVNTDMDDSFNRSLPDFRVKEGSPVIDAGGWLTTITSPSGSGIAFTVGDANYFMDGWGIVEGDTIQLEGQAQTAKITHVDYDTNVITVDTVLSWNAGQGVSLVYSGTAPDIGAHEYASLLGDISGDGAVTAYDAAIVLQNDPRATVAKADVNGDGVVDALDATLIGQRAVGG